MNTVLAIETATDICSAALMVRGSVLAEISLPGGRRHAEALVPSVDQLVAEAGIARSGLDAIAVSMGPGSYTGLRIGVSTAKAIAEALDIRLMGVPSLLAAADAALEGADALSVGWPGGRMVIAAFPSRRDQVFAAAFEPGPSGVAPAGPVLSGRPADVIGDLTETELTGALVVGSGAARFEGLPALRIHPTHSSASAIGRIALRPGSGNLFVDVQDFEPYYLNPVAARTPTRSAFARLSL